MSCSLTVALLCLLAAPGGSRTIETRDDAFQRLFGEGARIERRTEFLSDADIAAIQSEARAPVEHARVTWYVIRHGDSLQSRAYIDTHEVRTKKETLLFVFDARGRVETIEVLAFHEPEDYLPTHRWYDRLAAVETPARALDGQDVDAISGATLSVRATCMALRRVVAIDRRLHPPQQPETP